MTLNETHKLANHIFRLLKLSDITFPIGRTNKGNLGIKFSIYSDDFDIMLDAVPLPAKDYLTDENNIELKEMIKKYWFEHEPIWNTGYAVSVESGEIQMAHNNVRLPIPEKKKHSKKK